MLFDLKRKRYKVASIICIGAMVLQLWTPGVSFSQTSGSGQTETMGGGGTSNMVDLFTGDFSYSIPLMEVDGFPILLQYDGNVSMNQEASWVGLGWSLNPGAINRETRGLPDDFDGDAVTRTLFNKMDSTKGNNQGGGVFFGFGIPGFCDAAYAGVGVEAKGGGFFNTYFGHGVNLDLTPSLNAGANVLNGLMKFGFSGNAGISLNSRSGIGWSKGGNLRAGFSTLQTDQTGFGMDIGASLGASSFNSSRGTKTANVNYGASISSSYETEDEKGMGSGHSYMGGRRINFGTRTYLPKINYATVGESNFLRLALGFYSQEGVSSLWLYGLYENYSSKFDIVDTVETQRAFGYMALESGVNSADALLDFNRENEMKVSSDLRVLPVTNLTYDLFRMSGAGSSGQFRAFRNDVGTVANARNISLAGGDNTTLEVGAGKYFRFSFTDGNQASQSASQPWNSTLHAAKDELSYKDVYSQNYDNETFYFKQIGELIPYDGAFFNQYGGDRPARLNIARTGDQVASGESITSFSTSGANPQGIPSSQVQGLPGQNFISGKQNRNTLIAQLSTLESADCGFETDILSYAQNDPGVIQLPGETSDSRQTSFKQDHHISEFQVTKSSGERCVYNIPVYTLKEKQVTFNASNGTEDCSTRLVEYTDGVNNNSNNDLGRDHLYNATETPAYAHSFLMRSMLSHDYNDRTGDGLSEDDYGSYIKFNYSRPFGESNPFLWKTPYNDRTITGSPSHANFQEINKTYGDDNLGQYVYGEKELYYVNSIEGKNYIALFYTSDRDDLVSVIDESGTLDGSKRGQLLDKIVLYNKEDLETNGANAEPIQTVNFEYDYSLCENYHGNINTTDVPTSNTGKLTLKRVYFTYSASQKGRLTPYEFEYNGINPDYNPAQIDRWGVYKNTIGCSTEDLNATDYPYTEQNQVTRDAAVSAWSMTDIFLPSGGRIHVDYESDDHAFTEDLTAMEMIPIASMAHHTDLDDYPAGQTDFLRAPNQPKRPHDIIYLDLPSPLVGTATHQKKSDFFNRYLKDIFEKHGKQVFFKANIETKNGNQEYEYVQGYFEIHEYGVLDNVSNVAWIQVSVVDVSDEHSNYQVNPILHAAWQHLRLNVPEAIWPTGVSGGGINGVDKSALFSGLNRALNNKEFAIRFDPDESFLRLASPNKRKLASGNRVKQITSFDTWSQMTSENEFFYGQTYDYTTTDANGNMISSGVASFEPTIGNEINPHRQPWEYTIRNEKLPDDLFHHQTPFGESFYASPMIGYEKVRVANLQRTSVSQNATGSTTHEFYTCKEFPTKTSRTPVDKVPIEVEPGFFAALVGGKEIDIMGMSQGFLIEKNDMHGKMKRVTSVNEFGSETSSVFYKYKGLNEPCTIIGKDGGTSLALLGKDMDIVADAQHTYLISTNASVNESIAVGNPPIPNIGLSAPSMINEEGYVLHSITKVAHNYAVLDEVITRHLGAEVTQKNIGYDEITGGVLVSSTTNEYNDPIFSASYPSHWYYDGMANAALTYNNHITAPIVDGGQIDFSVLPGIDPSDVFYPGDEILVEGPPLAPGCTRYWILSIDDFGQVAVAIDANGTLAPPTATTGIRVHRSGHKNQQVIPMSSFASLSNPVSGTDLDPQDILNASAVTFSDTWKARCDYLDNCNTATGCGLTSGNIVNPFRTGLLNNWRMERSYVYQVDRSQASVSDPVDVRNDGAYGAFIPFYAYNSSAGAWKQITEADHPLYAPTDDEKWLQVNRVIEYDDNGSAVEAQDVIGRFSGVLYGYNNNSRTVPIAVADNARSSDLAYDGFEDYLYFDHGFAGANCRLPGHFDFVQAIGGGASLSTAESHTGRYGLQVPAGVTVTTTRSTSRCDDDAPLNNIGGSGFAVEDCNCLTRFAPQEGRYTIGAWAKQITTDPVTQYTAPEILVEIKDAGGIVIGSTSVTIGVTEMIKGWQKMEGSFVVPAGASCIEVSLKNNDGTDPVFFDDLRIHPFRSTMVSHVYDPLNLRKWSDLNDYNYATIYEYNEQGLLVRVKQETVDGMKTISESRSGLIKQ